MTDVKKATALTAATSLESSDSILAFDSTGKAKKITAEEFKDFGTEVITTAPPLGWVRIAKNKTGCAASGIISVVSAPAQQQAFLIKIAVGLNARLSQSDLTISGADSYSNKTEGAIQKMRILKPAYSGNPWFMELFISESKEIKVKKAADLNIELLNFEPSNETPPTGYTAIEIMGGGKHLILNSICGRRRLAA